MTKLTSIPNPKSIFWIFQCITWSFLICLGLLGEFITTETITSKTVISSIIIFTGSVLITTLFRYIILINNWLTLSFSRMVFRFIFCSFIFAFIHYQYTVLGLYIFNFPIDRSISNIISQVLSNLVLFFIWSIGYSTYFFIQNKRQQELKNLKLLSAKKDMELNVLKNQLNPHFLFNALNSIRALIEDDPTIAKNSITQLSNVLRNTLVLGQQESITIEDELKIVTDYLQLEKIRYEERLTIQLNIEPTTRRLKIPPLLIQTFVENAIKHGISKRSKGGEVTISTSLTTNNLVIEILNDGFYEKNKPTDTGIGLINIKKRLTLIYPTHSLSISNQNDKVIAKIELPLNIPKK